MKKGLLFAILMIGAGVFAETTPPLIENDFEQENDLKSVLYLWPPAGKKAAEMIELASEPVSHGAKALLVRVAPPRAFGIFIEANGDFKAGESYTASVYVSSPSARNISMHLSSFPEKRFKKRLQNAVAYLRANPKWKLLKTTLTLEKDAKVLGITIRVGDKGAEEQFYLDSLRLEPGKTASPRSENK